MIGIVPYDPDWPASFCSLAQALRPAMPVGAVLHHIGSTAVPGLPAKNIIDMQMTVASLAEVDPVAMASAGFIERAFISDHPPPGMALAQAGLAKRFFQSQGRPANLHIRVAGRFNQRYALLFRDYLRTHPLATGAYASIKQRLVTWFSEDDDAYYEIKDPVCDIIIAAALDWATMTGWTVPVGD